MARFDLYPALSGPGYVLDVQSDLLTDLNTRVVVPVLPARLAPRPAAILNPVFDLGDEPHVMVTQFLSAIPAGRLKDTRLSLKDQSDRITRALDFLYQGF